MIFEPAARRIHLAMGPGPATDSPLSTIELGPLLGRPDDRTCKEKSADGPTVIHVAPDGNDTGDGSKQSPLATIAAARDRIRVMKASGGLPNGGVVVEIAPGRYALTGPVELTAEDSGTAESPIVYRAGPGDRVVLSGSTSVTDWKPVTDEAVLKRLPAEARGKVFQADLKALGVTEYGDLDLDAEWELQRYLSRTDNQGEDEIGNAMASRTHVKNGGTVSPRAELFFDGVPMRIAQWPNEGFTRIEKVLGETPINVRGVRGCREGIFVYEDNRISRWVDEKDALVKGYWFRDWGVQCHKIASIDPAKRIISVKQPYHCYGYRAGQWFLGFNLLCELDAPGEWYIDRATGILYFWPPGMLKDARAEISTCQGIFRLTDVSHVTFEGLQMEAARGTAVAMKDCGNCRVVGCTFRNLGNHAVTVFQGKNCGVVGCDMSEMGGGGIYLIGGDRKTLTPGGHYAENNHIHHYGRWDRVYRPAIHMSGVGLRASHNLIHHAPHAAILFGGQEHLFEYNEIHNVCHESHDCGAIYAGRSWCLQGNVFRHNYLHHIWGKDGGACRGIYLDDEFSGALIQGNIFHQVYQAVFLGGGRDNVVENNIFVDCPKAFHVDARGIGWAAYAVNPRIQKARETGVLCGVRFQKPPFSTRYPKLAAMLDDEPAKPKGNVARRNIFWEGDGAFLRRLFQRKPIPDTWWKAIEHKVVDLVKLEDNLVNVDPRFSDTERECFQFQKDSPAWKLGFEPIPTEKIGLYDDVCRATWPVEHAVTPLPDCED